MVGDVWARRGDVFLCVCAVDSIIESSAVIGSVARQSRATTTSP